jgi:transcription termination/antitermination protein NusA
MITQPDGSEDVRRLFHEHVPALANGIVEIVAIARERGHRSMLAVYSSDHSVDPIGSCVGLRGVHAKSVMQQLSGEYIDIVRWSESVEDFIRDTLAPAVVRSIALDETRRHATVRLDSKRSNGYLLDPIRLRLASKVTGWELQIVEI